MKCFLAMSLLGMATHRTSCLQHRWHRARGISVPPAQPGAVLGAGSMVPDVIFPLLFFVFPFLPELRWCSSSLAAEGRVGWMSSGPRGCGCSGTHPAASSCHGCWARADPQGSGGTGDTSPSPLGNCTGWCCAWGVPTSNKARLSPPGGDVASGSRIFSWCPTLASSRCASRGLAAGEAAGKAQPLGS